MKTLFKYRHYKPYLAAVLGSGQKRTGQRARLAEHLGCQTAHISQVLNGHGHFSNEQAFRVNSFLGHDREESHYFFLLVQMDRAGSEDLIQYYQQQIDEIHKKRSVIRERIKTTTEVPPEHQSRYYSSWHYLAIHMALSVSELQTKEALSQYFHLPIQTVAEVLQFLMQTGLAESHDGRYLIGPSHVHLGNEADNVNKHHMNWRVQAMESLTRVSSQDLHYSVVFSLSREDARLIQDRIIEMIKANLKDVGPSKEEVLFTTCIDFFQLRR